MERLIRFAMLVLVVFAVVGISLSCDREPTDPSGGGFSGLVVDSVSRAPIDSAMVSLRDTSGVSVYTDSTGYFQGAAFGSVVTIYVRKEGYHTAWKVRDLTKNATDVLFQLVPVSNN